jgi:MSHA biogenesis protein MshP
MNKQGGFSIVMAIFILVVLGLLGGYMVKLTGVQYATSTYAAQGARAYQAARAGIEWGLYKLLKDGSCVASTVLTLPDINGFSVTLSCANSPTYTEGADSHVVYKITALSEYGIYNNANYISRNIEVSIVN